MKQRGQGLVEVVIFLPLVFGGLGVCLFLFYVFSKRLWVDHQLYQSLVCLSQRVEEFRCRRKLESGIRAFLWMGDRVEVLQFSGGENQWSGYLVIGNMYQRGVWKKRVVFRGDL